MGQDGKYVVDVDKDINIAKCTPNTRVALKKRQVHIVQNFADQGRPLGVVDEGRESARLHVRPLRWFREANPRDQRGHRASGEAPRTVRELRGVPAERGSCFTARQGPEKTLLARACAHHTDCTFIRVSGAELVQKYIGEGARMVRELFVMAREAAPSIIFMDEIDSIGGQRDGKGKGGDSEVQRTMLELLNQLDGFEPKQNIKVIMATNRIDILDSALLRPGRIDRKIEFPHPNEKSRESILKIHSRKMNLMRGIDLKSIAEKMSNTNGAECKAVCTEAGMFALRERRIHVTQEDFEMARAKVMKKDSEANTSLKKLWK